MKWYYLSEENEVIGPVSETALRELRACGDIKNETRVCREGTEDWITSTEIFDPVTPVATSEVFKFSCPHCSQHIAADVSHVGMEAQCPACGVKMLVPKSHPCDLGGKGLSSHARPKVLLFAVLGLAGLLAIGSLVLLVKIRSSRLTSDDHEPGGSEVSMKTQEKDNSGSKAYSFTAGPLPALSRPAPEGFVLIPEGSFTMGDSLDGMEDAPLHEVHLNSFYMGRYEVTRALWKRVIKWGQENGYEGLSKGWDDSLNGEPEDNLERDKHPAYWMGWYGVVKWCNAYSEMEGLRPCYLFDGEILRGDTILDSKNDFRISCDFSRNGYRLPTEAEWEKAARGGKSGLRFPWGDEINQKRARYDASKPYHLPVGSFPPNDFGLYDMAGNVAEWCWDCYDSDFYRSSTKWDSYDQKYFRDSPKLNPIGPPVQVLNWENQVWRRRVYRGGSGDTNANPCLVAARRSESPSYRPIGFRLVCR